ncbi:serine hydrolase FSH [Ophiocordyceps camponoti-floridani]|uniref:Serine hydrolase FSH n=1 Tax=Ophiocordyceps camponoti-floridani TaxID=2030778 RepID=A0A8H4QBG7_9HYPO|nr:serine hydrolase FSH [Ophiocordyceps camponoti-floridani]
MLVAGLLFKRQMEDPTGPLPFRFAIFIAGAPPLTWSDSVGQNMFNQVMSEDPLDVDKDSFDEPEAGIQGRPNVEYIKEFGRKLYRDLTPELEKWVQTVEDMGTDPEKARLMPHAILPQLHPDRLDLPTAHMWGRNDVLSSHSGLLFRLCSPDFALSHVHEGVHDVPQSSKDNEIFSNLVRKTILRSQFAV